MRICFLGTDMRLDYLRGFASPGVTLDNMTTSKAPSRVPSAWRAGVKSLPSLFG